MRETAMMIRIETTEKQAMGFVDMARVGFGVHLGTFSIAYAAFFVIQIYTLYSKSCMH